MPFLSPMRFFGLTTVLLTVLIGCGATPTPAPTPTPIPAYEAFAQYYDENCWHTTNYLDGVSIRRAIDLSVAGRAVYVGDGIWRFRIMEKTTSSDWLGPGQSEEETLAVEEKVITTRSLADGSWEEPCPDAGESNEWDWNDEYYPEPPAEVDEPSEDSPWDSVRP